MPIDDRPDGDPAVRLIQISDVHYRDAPGTHGFVQHDPDAGLAAALAHAADALSTADVLVASGDLADTGEPGAYRRLGDVLQELPVPVYCLPGNHDSHDAYTAGLPRTGVHLEPAVRIGKWLLLMVDTNALGREHVGDGVYRDLDDRMTRADGPELSAPEAARIREILAGSDAEHVLLFVHQPPLAEISPHLDPSGRLDALLGDFGHIRAISGGHLHGSLEGEFAGVPVFVAPSTTYSIDYAGKHFDGPGYRTFTLHPDGRVESRAHTAPGPITDAMRAKPAPRFLTDLMLGVVTIEEMREMTDEGFLERFGEPRPVRGA
ncbi:metallophosphoesterase [Embleya sp. NBC_00888]|uniref:metallophosphoesterase n=1 Tax=Embleya sp. NBC_00888 TaxID=2975960 RepID=UPI00386903F0|nr:metallophosphoesterase [Embleya sp. NBC_00888]